MYIVGIFECWYFVHLTVQDQDGQNINTQEHILLWICANLLRNFTGPSRQTRKRPHIISPHLKTCWGLSKISLISLTPMSCYSSLLSRNPAMSCKKESMLISRAQNFGKMPFLMQWTSLKIKSESVQITSLWLKCYNFMLHFLS